MTGDSWRRRFVSRSRGGAAKPIAIRTTTTMAIIQNGNPRCQLQCWVLDTDAPRATTTASNAAPPVRISPRRTSAAYSRGVSSYTSPIVRPCIVLRRSGADGDCVRGCSWCHLAVFSEVVPLPRCTGNIAQSVPRNLTERHPRRAVSTVGCTGGARRGHRVCTCSSRRLRPKSQTGGMC
jgi:hypothetical protein